MKNKENNMKHLNYFHNIVNESYESSKVCEELTRVQFHYLRKDKLKFSDREIMKLEQEKLSSEDIIKMCSWCYGNFSDCEDCSGHGTKYEVDISKIDDSYFLIWFLRRGETDLFFKIDGFSNLLKYLQVIKYVINDQEELIPEEFTDDDFVAAIY